MEVGFLGLGIMGKAMATNLIKSGFKVTVWNRTLSKCNELVELGASIGETPAAVVKKCELTIAILSDPAATLSMEFLKKFCNGKGYIDMSTVDPETSTNISKAITAKGGSFLEAPVSGSKQPAEAGQLVILAAGDKAELPIPCLGERTSYAQEQLLPCISSETSAEGHEVGSCPWDENAVSMPVAAAANEVVLFFHLIYPPQTENWAGDMLDRDFEIA
ncbi:hypothetical protein GH714_024076 [Hevea brasiliensis]|uniref:6-phosphogluconate dehydrogenase NADP-binding domain-containing protein n=1 Tax=Hevea brasiliensis TaxID=3981 RepID=A0A6A6KLQ8_HEVBR|nr:hypothetical protein GH714_024076 [Hevea brasiliensis]